MQRQPGVLFAAFCCLALFNHTAQPARILGIFPHVGKSHFFAFEPLLKALAARGHDLHVISPFPQPTPLTNYTDIDIARSVPKFESTEGIPFDMFDGGPSRFTVALVTVMLSSLGKATCEGVLAHPSITRLLHSNETFDLVMTELFNADCFLGFVHKFQAPHIALSSCALMPWAGDRFGNPDNPSYIPNIMAGLSDRMSLVERVENTVFYLAGKLLHYFLFSRPQQVIASNYFGSAMPSLYELARNTSLIMVNSHPSLNRPRPLVPSVIEVGGLHVEEPKKLQDDLEKWMSEAPEGVIYFSLGSMLRTSTLPAEKVTAFLEAFGELPQRVLWKFDGDSLTDRPDNVRIGKWLPQRDILAHPNVRLMIAHCGLLGLVEAVISAVPVVGIPMFGDQHTNFQAIAAAGAAVHLDYMQISKESVLTALREVLGNSSYRENAQRLSQEYTDRPLSAMDTAIYWTEYVIRHRGAHHLRSAAVDLPWYQYLLLDVTLLVLGTIILVTIAFSYLIKMFVGVCKNNKRVKHKQQ